MAPTGTMISLEVDSTFGCLFIAVILTSALWGVGCLQFYQYCEKFWKAEQRWLKVSMPLLWILDTVHQALISKNTYICFVRGIVDPVSLQNTEPAIAALTAIIDALAQINLVRRAWYLSDKNRVLTGTLGVAVLAQFALTMVFFARIVSISEITELHRAIPTELAAAVVSGITDTFLAATLVYLLRKARSGFKKSDSIVNCLVTYTIGSSLITAVCALVALIGAAAAPYSFIYLFADFLLPKLYFNCLLASLNARSKLRATTEGDMSIHLENICSSPTEAEHISGRSASNADKDAKSNRVERRADIDVEGGTNVSVREKP